MARRLSPADPITRAGLACARRRRLLLRLGFNSGITLMSKAAKRRRIQQEKKTLEMSRAYNQAIAAFLAAGERFDPGALAKAVIAQASHDPSPRAGDLAQRAVHLMRQEWNT